MAHPLSSLGPAPRVAVIGASGGIGGAFVRVLEGQGGEVLAFSRSAADGHGFIDIGDEASIAAAAERAGRVDAVLVATGLLHDGAMQPEKDWRALDAEAFARAFAVNATGPALVAKHFLERMPRRGRSILGVLSARVGSVSDNRKGGWYAYRASKAALNQVLRTLAVEAARKRPDLVIAGLQPGTVRTALSAPFAAGQGEGTLAPDEAARHLLAVLDGLAPAMSGRLFDWRGEEFPP